MRNSARLPVRFPAGTKYVIEGRGSFVERYVEFPDGRRVQLAKRKAASCNCAAQQRAALARKANRDRDGRYIAMFAQAAEIR
jgi:hypothetical protein